MCSSGEVIERRFASLETRSLRELPENPPRPPWKLVRSASTSSVVQEGTGFVSFVSVRYIVDSVDRALPFYEALGFRVVMHPAPGFAALRKGDLRLLLNQPGAGGAGQAMPDGEMPAPGGWNRIQISVEDLEAVVRELKVKGLSFRNEIVVGNGGKQILAVDPAGNFVELQEPTARGPSA